MATRMMLERAGHEVVGEAKNGIEVVSQVRTLAPDLIILDMDMPHLDGFAVLQRLHAEPKAAKIIVFSGLDASRYAVRCARAGASGFVAKESHVGVGEGVDRNPVRPRTYRAAQPGAGPSD
jgi:two-component system response regulator EvgA